jgi:hypothetical protein
MTRSSEAKRQRDEALTTDGQATKAAKRQKQMVQAADTNPQAVTVLDYPDPPILPQSLDITSPVSDGIGAICTGDIPETDPQFITRETEDEDDKQPPMPTQPKLGWKNAQRKLGYSQSSAGKSKQSRYYYNQKKRRGRRRVIGLVRLLGISVVSLFLKVIDLNCRFVMKFRARWKNPEQMQINNTARCEKELWIVVLSFVLYSILMYPYFSFLSISDPPPPLLISIDVFVVL